MQDAEWCHENGYTNYATKDGFCVGAGENSSKLGAGTANSTTSIPPNAPSVNAGSFWTINRPAEAFGIRHLPKPRSSAAVATARTGEKPTARSTAPTGPATAENSPRATRINSA